MVVVSCVGLKSPVRLINNALRKELDVEFFGFLSFLMALFSHYHTMGIKALVKR